MRKPRNATIANRSADERKSDDSELLADGRQDEIGVPSRQVPRVAEPEAGARRSRPMRERPDRMRHLVAARGRVVPRRLPHAHALGQRVRHVQPIADVKAETSSARRRRPPCRSGRAPPRTPPETRSRAAARGRDPSAEKNSAAPRRRRRAPAAQYSAARQVDPCRQPARSANRRCREPGAVPIDARSSPPETARAATGSLRSAAPARD